MPKVMPVIVSSLLALGLVTTGSAAQPVDTKGEKDLVAEGQKIDKATAPADSRRVTERIVKEWNGTKFRFEPNTEPRELTSVDVQNLRQTKLGYGEISILLALTAKQPDSGTAKSLNEILAMRQAGGGWGKLAQELGYENLGSVLTSVKATEHEVGGAAAGRSQKPDAAGKPDKPEKIEKVEKPGKTEHPEKPQRAAR